MPTRAMFVRQRLTLFQIHVLHNVSSVHIYMYVSQVYYYYYYYIIIMIVYVSSLVLARDVHGGCIMHSVVHV